MARLSVRVAGIVLKWVRGDKEANYRRVDPLIREAAAGGAEIVCTTECFLDGYAIADVPRTGGADPGGDLLPPARGPGRGTGHPPGGGDDGGRRLPLSHFR